MVKTIGEDHWRKPLAKTHAYSKFNDEECWIAT
jgi:hypothetical protein